jgi:hypothetical protein
MHAHSADIETAFLNADLQEGILMRQPKGADHGTSKVMRMLKSICGPKQASREWYSLFHRTLTSLGLKRSTSYTSLHSMNHGVHGLSIIIVVYIDDILTVSDSLVRILATKLHIGRQLNMIVFGVVIKPILQSGKSTRLVGTLRARPVHGSRDENITSRIPRAFWYSN